MNPSTICTAPLLGQCICMENKKRNTNHSEQYKTQGGLIVSFSLCCQFSWYVAPSWYSNLISTFTYHISHLVFPHPLHWSYSAYANCIESYWGAWIRPKQDLQVFTLCYTGNSNPFESGTANTEVKMLFHLMHHDFPISVTTDGSSTGQRLWLNWSHTTKCTKNITLDTNIVPINYYSLCSSIGFPPRKQGWNLLWILLNRVWS